MDQSGKPIHFKAVLTAFTRNPSKYTASVYCTHHSNPALNPDPDLVVIYDRFPKARNHLLILPTRAYLDSDGIHDLTPASLPKLREMHSLGRRICAWLQAGGRHEHRLGYHAVPSIPHLHLHLISTDLSSEKLTKRTHWNSFTTDFFVSPEVVEQALTRDGSCGCILSPFRAGSALSGVGMGGDWVQRQPLRCPK